MVDDGQPAHASFRNIQCNVQQTDRASVVEHHIDEVAKHGDVIGWNELGSAALQHHVRSLPGFSTYCPSNVALSAGSVSISWRTNRFTLLDKGCIKVHGGVAHVTPPRFILWVELHDKHTGKTFIRVNTHVVHHIEVSGRPRVRGALSGQNARAKKHFAMLRRTIVGLKKRAPVIAGGDFNVSMLAEKHLPPSKRCAWFPYTQLSPVIRVAMGNHGTHGGRAIDWTLLSTGVHEVSQTILPHGSSDHNPVLTVVSL